MSTATPLTNEEWRAKYAEKHFIGGGTMTLDQVKGLTEHDLRAARTNPDFFPSINRQSEVLCERLLAVGQGDRLSLMSKETITYAKSLEGRGWISMAALKTALFNARREQEADRDTGLDQRSRDEGMIR
jgi:hypothetical protein